MPQKPKTKQATMLALLRRKNGASLNDLMSASGWQAHSVRGFLSGTVKKKMQLPLQTKTVNSVRKYSVRSAR
ncbi:MAG: DUF3489 domain-containing protein [Pseudomonadota bacterium]